MTGPETLTIGEVAEKTGVSEGTLRMWEARHGFPEPGRLANGRRVYSRSDVARIKAVTRGRSEGLSLAAAIERARRSDEPPRLSVYQALRERFPHLHPRNMNKQALLWLTRAAEDECSARADRPLWMGCFQEERFYRQSEHRWRHLSRQFGPAVALAAFPGLRVPEGRPAEVPLDPGDTLLNEWAVICHDRVLSVCVIGRERPGGERDRQFEVVWTVEPDVVEEAARVCLRPVAQIAPDLAREIQPLVSGPARPVTGPDLQTALDLASRVTAYATENTDG